MALRRIIQLLERVCGLACPKACQARSITFPGVQPYGGGAIRHAPKFGACRAGVERQPHIRHKACREYRDTCGNRPRTDSTQETPVLTIGAVRVDFRHAYLPKESALA